MKFNVVGKTPCLIATTYRERVILTRLSSYNRVTYNYILNEEQRQQCPCNTVKQNVSLLTVCKGVSCTCHYLVFDLIKVTILD